MRKPRVLLDCDGILANFIDPCLEAIHEFTPERFTHDDVREWAIEKSLNISKDIWDQAYKRMQRPGFCSSIPLYPGAKEGVAALHKIADVYIVTSPLGGPNWAHEREVWLKDNFNVPASNVASMSSKFIVSGDLFCDDKTSHLIQWSEHQHGVAVRWERLYNAGDGWNGLRTNNWDTFLGIVQGVGACLK